jgi:hypothetical protein
MDKIHVQITLSGNKKLIKKEKEVRLMDSKFKVLAMIDANYAYMHAQVNTSEIPELGSNHYPFFSNISSGSI